MYEIPARLAAGRPSQGDILDGRPLVSTRT